MSGDDRCRLCEAPLDRSKMSFAQMAISDDLCPHCAVQFMPTDRGDAVELLAKKSMEFLESTGRVVFIDEEDDFC